MINEVFSPIDLQTGIFLYNKILPQQPVKAEVQISPASLDSSSQDLLAFFCYLAASFRQGCLFASCIHDTLVPPPEDPAVQDMILRGYNEWQALFQVSAIKCPYLVQKDQKIYFSAAAGLLLKLAQLSNKIMSSTPNLCLDEVSLRKSLDSLLEQNILLPEQAAAIAESAKTSLSCIWGGPGTGKTYTAGWLVKLFLEQHPTARIVLAAPTGKAAANLLKSIQKAVDAKSCESLESKTLHALLGLKRVGGTQKKVQLGYDLIIIDESSMIDASMCVKLLSAVADKSRIIFLGDPFQLPPIEPGEPFVAFVQQKKAQKKAGELFTTKRQENRCIIDLAQFVKDGLGNEAMSLLLEDTNHVLTFHSLNKQKFSPEEFVKQLYSQKTSTVEAFFETLLQIRILCPQRLGPFGTLAINNLMLQVSKTAKCGNFQPIIITKNDYSLGLTNGQVGVICGNTAYFEDLMSLREIPQVLLSSYETAYCLSVHKSQGSEFGEVILLLPEGSECFGRKMLYTAITRAKKKLTIYSTPDIFKACIMNEGRPTTTFL